MKPYFSRDHSELITRIWEGLSDEEKGVIVRAARDSVKRLHPEKEDSRLNLGEVVRAGWALGFHYALVCMEEGALHKASEIGAGEN